MPHATTEQIKGSGAAGSGHAPHADSHRSTPICEWQGAGWTDSCQNTNTKADTPRY